MDLPAPLAWLVDEASASTGPDRFLAELGSRLLADGLPLAGGALALAVPHPIIARRTFLWRAETGAVIEALAFAGAAPIKAGSGWLTGLGPSHEEVVGADSVLGWAGTRPFDSAEADRLRQVARFVLRGDSRRCRSARRCIAKWPQKNRRPPRLLPHFLATSSLERDFCRRRLARQK